MTVVAANINETDQIRVTMDKPVHDCNKYDFSFYPHLDILSVDMADSTINIHTGNIDLAKSYTLYYKAQKILVQPLGVLDRFVSYKELGCFWDHRETFFRVFASRATRVRLELFESFDQEQGQVYEMQRDADCVWEHRLPGQYIGCYYGYRIDRPAEKQEFFDPDALICDPYGKAVATRNEHLHRGKTLIMDTTAFDWEQDQHVYHDFRDLVIYECHLRDMTAHPSSGVGRKLAGSYPGFIQPGIEGGLEYIKSLGVNAVEFLPIQDFGNMELPYGINVHGLVNTWNPYSRNHWGYMTSYFFAPESYYAGSGNMQPGHICGLDGHQVFEFKSVVKACHKAGMAVILDMVFNHVSQYDLNPFKHIDKMYYFRLNDDNSFCSASGCGNDFKTERPMSRKMIVDCLKFWMREYHIDGFRFDLAAMIDWETVDQIHAELRKINPHVILIAEPWGGGMYTPREFSEHGWAAWNDQIRNGVKGQNPEHGLGYIFGQYFDYNNKDTIRRYITGNLTRDGGLFEHVEHAVNYLESHDDHTMGDFIRLGLGEAAPDQSVAGTPNEVLLTPKQLALNKLGALVLMISQGAVMISEGQEFARSKVISHTVVADSNTGKIDPNSYNKDNETNWINFEHAEINRELVDYYTGLIALRRQHPVFRKSDQSNIVFYEHENPFAISLMYEKGKTGDTHDFIILLNGDPEQEIEFKLPEDGWSVVVDADHAGTRDLNVPDQDTITLPPTSGMVLRK